MKKLSKRIAVMLACVLLISFSGCGAQSVSVPQLDIPMNGNTPPEINHTIELSTADLQTTAEIYRFVEPAENPEEILAKLSGIFGLSTGAQVEQYDNFVVMKDGKLRIEYETDTGMWSFRDNSYDKRLTHTLPSEEESAEIARTFLTENGLYDERFTMGSVVVSYSGDPADDTYAPYCNSVYFYPVLNDKPILGVSRIVVSIGENGQIIEVLKYYKDFVSYGEIELESPISFTEGIQTNQYSTSINSDAVSSTITEVELAYWEDAGSCEDQPFLQPVWVFTGSSVQSDGSEDTFDIIVQAAKNVENTDETSAENADTQLVPSAPIG